MVIISLPALALYRRMLLSASDATEQGDWITAISKAAPPSTTCKSTFVTPMQEQDCAQEDVQRSTLIKAAHNYLCS